MSVIDIGTTPSFDGDQNPGQNYTYINKDNPANDSGMITSIELRLNAACTDFWVGTFYITNGNTLKCRDSTDLGSLASGENLIIPITPIEVVAGDYIGWFSTTGKLEANSVGGVGRWEESGRWIDKDDEAEYYFNADKKASIYGTGTTVSAPTVTTQAVDTIEKITATGHGNITNTGGENCSKRGVCWNEGGSPTVADDKSEETDSFGTGAFPRSMTGLTPGQHYYVKAYAYNSVGYGYGGEVEFDTSQDYPISTTCNLTASATVAYLAAWDRATAAGLTASASVGIVKGFNIAIITALKLIVKAGTDWTGETITNLTVDSTVDKTITYKRTTSPGLTTAISLLKGWGRKVTTSASLTVSVAILKRWGRTIATTADLTISATVDRALAFKRSITKGLTISAIILKGWGRAIATTTGLTISATVVKGWGRTIATSTGLIALVSIARSFSRSVSITTNLTVSTTVSRLIAYARDIQAGLTISTTITATLRGIAHYLITIITNLTVSATVTRTLAYNRAVSAGLAVIVSIGLAINRLLRFIFGFKTQFETESSIGHALNIKSKIEEH